MATLFDTLKQRLQGSPAGASTEQAQALAQAKTGRAAGPGAGAPQLDLTRERIAVQEARAPEQQLATQATAQDVQIKAAEEQQAQQFRIETRNLQERRLQLEDNFVQQATQIVDRFTRENRKLDLDRDRAAAEQVAAYTRLTSESYVHKLQIEGAKSRLTSEILFEEELTRSMFGEYMELFEDELDFKTLMNASKRDFQKEMELFDFNTRKMQNRLATNAANARAKYQAAADLASGLTSAGIRAASLDWSGKGDGTPSDIPDMPAPLRGK